MRFWLVLAEQDLQEIPAAVVVLVVSHLVGRVYQLQRLALSVKEAPLQTGQQLYLVVYLQVVAG
jgi:hypothetical protein